MINTIFSNISLISMQLKFHMNNLHRKHKKMVNFNTLNRGENREYE